MLGWSRDRLAQICANGCDLCGGGAFVLGRRFPYRYGNRRLSAGVLVAMIAARLPLPFACFGLQVIQQLDCGFWRESRGWTFAISPGRWAEGFFGNIQSE